MQRTLLTLTLTFLAAACGAGDGDGGGDAGASTTYNQTNVSGMIGGAAWTFAGGQVLMDATPGGEANVGRFELFSEAIEGCAPYMFQPDDKKEVIWSAALIPGETPLGASGKSVTFYDNSTGENENSAALDGKYALDSVTDTSVSGRLIAHHDETNTVNGIFTVTRCCKMANGLDYEVCPSA